MSTAVTATESDRLRSVSRTRLARIEAGVRRVHRRPRRLPDLRGALDRAGRRRQGLPVDPGRGELPEVSAYVGIIGVAVSLLMIAGEFDLSVGSMIGAASLAVGLLIVQFHLPATIAVVLTFLFAFAIGAFNGWLRVKTRLPSFIVTLAMLLILRGAGIGITRLLTGNTIVSGVTEASAGDPIVPLFTASINIAGGEFKIVLLWWFAAVAVATWVLTADAVRQLDLRASAAPTWRPATSASR